MVQASARSTRDATSHPAIALTGHSIRHGVSQASEANVIPPNVADTMSRPVARLSENTDRA
jgi:hypothetical protein